MHPYFSISPLDIQKLDDEQARELVARLCKAELRNKSLAVAAVTWGGDQRAPDGGVDVRVNLPEANEISGYIPKKNTVYQVKAEKFNPAKISAEMAPHGSLRPSIQDLGERDGAYVIVSTRDHCSDISLNQRKVAMQGSIDKAKENGRIYIDFYDSRRVADWTALHPGIAIWLESVLGTKKTAWRPYGPWAYRLKTADDQYLLDDKVKVLRPQTDAAITVIDAINELRRVLADGGRSVRIVGLSGVGKTRLVQALFDQRILTNEPALPSTQVLYTDLSDDPDPQPLGMLEALLADGASGIMVVDNCGHEVHSRLTTVAQRSGSKIGLITIEYDIRDDLPDGTSCYRIEGASDEIITKLIKRHYLNLTDVEVDIIVRFSDGNARVAFALAGTSESKGELAQLRDDELFNRLFFQKNRTNDELQRCAEIASLLYSFDFEDDSEKSELAILASLANVTIPSFRRNIAELMRRGLVQARGRWRAVLPHAISNRLAKRALESFTPASINRHLIEQAPERVRKSFSRRLGYLHESREAGAIASSWLAPGGLLHDPLNLGDLHFQILENIAPICQANVLTKLLEAIKGSDLASLSTTSRNRMNRVLRSLAYETENFDHAALALLKIAIIEQAANNSESATETLKSLFFSHLSGTLAPPIQRANFLRELINSDREEEIAIALKILRATLEAKYFSSHYGFDFGALKRTYGWHPMNLEDHVSWYSSFIRITTELAQKENLAGAKARRILGSSIRSLWGNVDINKTLTDAAQVLFSIDGWPDGWIGVRTTLGYERNNLSRESLEQLQALEATLAPRDLWGKIKTTIFSDSIFLSDLDHASGDEEPIVQYERAMLAAEALGKAAALDITVLKDLRPFISAEIKTNKIFSFGRGLAHSSEEVADLMGRVKALIEQDTGKEFDLNFVLGLLEVWNVEKPEQAAMFLDAAITDSVWAQHFPTLQTAVRLDETGYQRLMRSLDVGVASPFKYLSIGYGRKTDALSVLQISSLIERLLENMDHGLFVALDILGMVIHCSSEKEESYRGELQQYTADLISKLDWKRTEPDSEHINHKLETLVRFALKDSDPFGVTKTTLERMFQYSQTINGRRERAIGKILRAFFEESPMITLDMVFAKSMAEAEEELFFVPIYRNGHDFLSPVSSKTIIDWCLVSPEKRCLFAAHGCKLFEHQNAVEDDTANIVSMSSSVAMLLEIAPKKKDVMDILVRRFIPSSWSGSRAEIIRQRANVLDSCNPTNSDEISALIRDAKKQLEERVKREERWEQEQERDSGGSFE